ncbi:heterokaryon incompatibility protein-domain-containing protein [Boletus edulis BED1]|uniref:Heterokaryon incompatibility protein-domain-containing protein n=1 Tax=Boletus edulis BED1 TaxID=1328754 RepID=A0AAD4GMC7_BOLED|nr:heterokaryon incompatibility protein-domain-containing protein [Boletus edulis BED1]
MTTHYRAPPDQQSKSAYLNNTDSTIKSLVCDACWGSIFSIGAWQTVLAAKQVPSRTRFSKGFSYKTTWATIQTAADRDGCNWCRLLARPNLAKTNGDSEVEVWAACDEDSDCTPAGEKKLTVVVHDTTGASSDRQYYMYTGPDDNAARFVKARDRITDVSSPESYKLALECLNNCVHTHHPNCPPPDQAARLPDRVIDCSDAKRPRIVLTDGNQHGLYLTLCYAWGGPQPMTTMENVDAYVTQGLDISIFPQTIQDAVLVTHNIGQRYLWIDALCIIQDSVEDRNRQLGKMREIYRNTYLTINAACAQSTREGFLRRYRPQKVPDARIPYRCPDGSVGSVWIAKQMDTDIPDASHSYWDELEPITYRGWCLQEKLLPPRSLVFASDTLKYFCQTETVNIGHALCEPSTGMRLPNAIYRPRVSRDSPLSEADQVTYRQAWLAVLFKYTLREISVPSDKLAALAGVAEQFHLSSHGEPRPRPESYRAPSWSWASVDGLVEAEYSLERKLANEVHLRKADILDCQVKLASEEAPFAEVTDGILKLKGLMKQVVLEGGRVLLKNQSQPSKHIGYVNLDAKEERPENVYVVLLAWDALGSFTVGIVVVTAGENQSRYRRIGRFVNDRELKNTGWLEGLSEQEIVLV